MKKPQGERRPDNRIIIDENGVTLDGERLASGSKAAAFTGRTLTPEVLKEYLEALAHDVAQILDPKEPGVRALHIMRRRQELTEQGITGRPADRILEEEGLIEVRGAPVEEVAE